MMIQAIPELNSEYATVPMANGNWHKPEETLEKEVPCFIPAEEQGPIKKDYIWMPAKGDLDAGYYHLRTQEAYIRIYDLMSLYKAVKQLMYLRLHCDYPSDMYAMRMNALNKKSFAGAMIIPTPLYHFKIDGKVNAQPGFH
ncbi:MAG: hypothetical protein SGARI_007005 [Bacillariaceae sp.]